MADHVRDPVLQLAMAFVLTTPLNRAMIRRGRGHAILHRYHHAAPSPGTGNRRC